MSGSINPTQLAAALMGTGGQPAPQPPSALANGNAGVNAQVPLGSLPPSLGLAPGAGASHLPWYAAPGMAVGTPAPGAGAMPGAPPGLPPAVAPPGAAAGIDPALLARMAAQGQGGGGP
jgi:hypothetical protein